MNDLPQYTPQLTDEEKAILALLLEGISNMEIAERLGVSPIHTSLLKQDLVRKFRVSNENELVRTVKESGASLEYTTMNVKTFMQNQIEIQKKQATQAANDSARRLVLIFGWVLACVVVAIGLWLLVVLTRPEIKTSAGTLVITKIHFADRVPPGCTSSSPTCSVAESGYRILIIWMGPKSGGNIQTLSNVIPRGVYVVADDGSQTEWFNQTMNVSPPFITLAFAVKDSERSFKVVWPDNPDVDLNPLLYFIP
jgi:DNA-binding CsgD family transcriptional regulator